MFDEKIKFKYSWRPYQAKVLKEVDKYLVDKKINIVAAPGSGKTVLGLELARKIGKAVLILSPTVTIKNQWIDRFVTLFMPDESQRPEWVSDNIYNLNYFNSVTYQGLHYAYKRRKQKQEINLEETDDTIIEESNVTDLDIKEYDLIEQIKKNNIGTIVLDEAHHLKSEWWQSLTKTIESLENITIISLTATPPYDVEYGEWKRYIELCGNIDMEISVPELVAAKNLCPHQDYVYFSYPTKNEKEEIKKYENQVKELMDSLKENTEFIDMIRNHPYILYTENFVEDILNNTGFYSSMLVFLNASNTQLDKEKVRILGHDSPIPKYTLEWLEILLQNIIFEKAEVTYFEKYYNLKNSIEEKLNKLGAIENNKVVITKNSTLQKYFVNSMSKMDSINEIVKSEYANLREKLRMVILTDFIRKEYLETEQEIKTMGVMPIFLNLIKEQPNLNVGILTGNIFMIPNSKKEKLIEIANENQINKEEIDFIQIEVMPTYSIVKTTNKKKNLLMKSISKLFSIGEINIIIGTKSLLGEGWDEPSINSLILASFVGSYVLSNQMRGRAIRTNDNPQKTANIWHLVCVMEQDEILTENPDFEMLKRRFNSFVGIGYNRDTIENGIARLDTIPKTFSKFTMDKYNKELLELSNDRDIMYDRWFYLIEEYGGKNINIQNQVEANNEIVTKELVAIKMTEYLKLTLSSLALMALGTIRINFTTNSFSDFFVMMILTFILYLVLFLIVVLCNLKTIIKIIRAIKFSYPEKQLKTIAKVTVKSLCDEDILKTKFEDIKIYSKSFEEKIYTGLSFDGVTTHENNIIVNSLEEILGEIVDPRYILKVNGKKSVNYYNVPEVLAQNKQMAQTFQSNWNKYIGECELIYTRTQNGRNILIEARKKTFNYTSEEKFLKKQKPLSKWK